MELDDLYLIVGSPEISGNGNDLERVVSRFL